MKFRSALLVAVVLTTICASCGYYSPLANFNKFKNQFIADSSEMIPKIKVEVDEEFIITALNTERLSTNIGDTVWLVKRINKPIRVTSRNYGEQPNWWCFIDLPSSMRREGLFLVWNDEVQIKKGIVMP